MSIPLTCSCGKTFAVPDKHRGKKVRCPGCGEPVKVEDSSTDDGPDMETSVASGSPNKRRSSNDDEGHGEEVRKPIKRKKAEKRGMGLYLAIGAGGCGLLLLLALIGCGGGGYWIYQGRVAEEKARVEAEKKRRDEDERFANRQESINILKNLGLALHGFHDAYKSMPNYAIQDPQSGQALLSWRVAILPFVDQTPLYQQIRLNEPWDSPHNRQFGNKMPKVYQLPGKPNDGKTHYQVFVGEGSAFPKWTMPGQQMGGARVTLVGMTDGTSNTIFVTEAANPVDWMRPEDIPFPNSAQSFSLSGVGNHWGDDTFNVVMGDACARRFRRTMPPRDLHAMITRAGGEVVDWSEWELGAR